NAWPRVSVDIEDKAERLIVVEHSKTLEEAKAKMYKAPRFKPPFQVVLASYGGSEYHPEEGVLVYIVLTHMFSDGFAIVPLMTDLASMVACVEASPSSSVPQHALPGLTTSCQVLEQRIMRTINGDFSFAQGVTPQPLDTSKWGEGMHAIAIMPRELVEAVRRAARVLAVAPDLVMLGALGVALAKLNQKAKLTIQMVVPQRDGPGESDMVGLFADQRLLDVLTEDLSYAGVVLALHHVVK
ncbi:unnamed protein product, partial [Polarella glacialis]